MEPLPHRQGDVGQLVRACSAKCEIDSAAPSRVMRKVVAVVPEVERKVYTIAIGIIALSVVTFVNVNFAPLLPLSAARSLLHLGIKGKVIASAEGLVLAAFAVLVCVPFLKATRARLSLLDSMILSVPPAYVSALSLCEGFEWWLVPAIIVWPLLFLAGFRVLKLRAMPSLVDDVFPSPRPAIRLPLAVALSFQVAVLSLFLSGASSPFRIKISYVAFLVGAVTALSARLRPHWALVLLAAALFMINVRLFWPAAGLLRAVVQCPP